jgi:hypothetical protein
MLIKLSNINFYENSYIAFRVYTCEYTEKQIGKLVGAFSQLSLSVHQKKKRMPLRTFLYNL